MSHIRASKYPVGARWQAKNHLGHIVNIWLAESGKYFDMWKWDFCYSDGSGYESDWNTSYRKCHEECSFRVMDENKKPIRFKRVQ